MSDHIHIRADDPSEQPAEQAKSPSELPTIDAAHAAQLLLPGLLTEGPAHADMPHMDRLSLERRQQLIEEFRRPRGRTGMASDKEE
ncbi:MAG: hypothetical protein JNM31_01785 [Flavobacteriales bacterium]|nr:hypothetical protein [Flavobacteriales bacterium]